MTMYVVNHISSIDCYKRAESNTVAIYTGNSQDEAYAAAVNCWLDLWNYKAEWYCDDGDPPPMGDGLIELLPPDGYHMDTKSIAALHSFFCDNAWNIWEPEYINSPTEQVEIQVMNNKSDSTVTVDEKLVKTARKYCMGGE